MHFLTFIKDAFFNFLFPKSQRVTWLEKLSLSTLLSVLPPAKDIESKSTLALFDYNDPLVKEIVWEIKYSGNRRMADKLGAILYDHLDHELNELRLFESTDWRMSKPILVPMPVSDKRRFERGWNPSEILCELMLTHDKELQIEYLPRQLIKSHHTESQTKISRRSERLRNLTNSMKIRDPESVVGKCVIVLDDVTTTGATFAEARRALRAAGARKILCVAVAH